MKGKYQISSFQTKMRRVVSFTSKATMKEWSATEHNNKKILELLMDLNLQVWIGVKEYSFNVPQSMVPFLFHEASTRCLATAYWRFSALKTRGIPLRYVYSSPMTRLLQRKRAQEHHNLVPGPLVVYFGIPQMTGCRIAGWRDNLEVGKVGDEEGKQGEYHSKKQSNRLL